MLRKCAWWLLALLCALPALADSKARIVRISYVEGDVELDRGDSQGFIRAFQNMPIIEGVRLWTRADARAEVEFEDGSTLRLVPDSLIDFQDLRLGNSGEKITRIDVQQGTLYADLKDHDHDQMALTFAKQELSLRHSSRFRLNVEADQLKVAVFRGELELQRTNAERVKIKKNETLAIDFAEPDRYYLAKGITEEPHDYWDREREEQRVAAEVRYRQNTSPVSTVYYGYTDLAPYGAWVSVPTYGYLWRPYNVAYGWDPFAYGAWVWYPGCGYVWSSAYPWGWTPFRYGSWVFVNNRGWFWRGGPRINITNINIVNAPRAYVPPRPPAVVNTNIVTVNNGVPRPVDPRGEWMPRIGPRGIDTGKGFGRGATNTPGVFTAVNGNGPRPEAGPAGGRTDEAVASHIGAGPSATQPRDIQRNPSVTTKTASDPAARVRTHDPDYNAVDYRRPASTQANRPPTAPGNDVVEAARIQRGRPDPDRDDVSRGPVNRTPAAEGRVFTPDSNGPQRNSAPGIDRGDPRPAPRSTPAPPIDRAQPTPQVDRPAPPPQVNRPSPPPQIDRSAPPPQMNPPAPRPSPPPRDSNPRSSSSADRGFSAPRSSPPAASAPASSFRGSSPSAPSPSPARSGGGGRSRNN